MYKKIFLIVSLLCFTIIYGQSYERKWGTMIPIYDQPEKPFSPVRQILSTPFVAEVNPKTGNLYIVSENFNEIREFKDKNSNSKLFYKIPGIIGMTFIEQIKFDTENNFIISGKTSNPDLATHGAFSEEMVPSFNSGNTFIAKINNKGKLIWFTYFYEIPIGKMAIAIDKNNNIYILNKRFRGDILDASSFQKNGDMYSIYDFQDVVSKLNSKGQHLWSTFYSKDDSSINAIMAADNGLYIYGSHQGKKISENYFGTPSSFQENISNEAIVTSSVFLSKFNFEGGRLWSTYFGNATSSIPHPINNTVKNPYNLTVIGDEAYFISSHKGSSSTKSKINLATENVLLNTPPFSIENHALSKFSSNGNREWTTYLPTAGHLFKSLHNNELFISTSIDIKNGKNITTTPNSYQTKNGGMQDIYTYTVSLNGKEMNYNTYYGYDGNDSGFTIPTINGYFTIGYSSYYKQETSLFATKKAPISKFTLFDKDIYLGNFLGYFSKKVN